MINLNKKGYIIILALMIISLCTAIITRVVIRVNTTAQLARFNVKTENAKQLALSGLEIAIAQLSKEKEQEKTDKKTTTTNTPSELDNIIPIIGKWQVFKLNKEKEESEAETIKIFISAENGKIDLNKLFDFKKNEFKKFGNSDGKKILSFVDEQLKKANVSKFLEPLESLIKKRKKPFFDLTQLFESKDLESIKDLFFITPDQDKEKTQIYITDFLTVDADSDKMSPWLLSNSVLQAIGGKAPGKGNKESIEKLLKKIKDIPKTIDVKNNWKKYFEPLYGVAYEPINQDVKQFFSNKFQANNFSVISYGITKNQSSRLFAIVQKTTDDKAKQVKFTIKRLYWF